MRGGGAGGAPFHPSPEPRGWAGSGQAPARPDPTGSRAPRPPRTAGGGCHLAAGGPAMSWHVMSPQGAAVATGRRGQAGGPGRQRRGVWGGEAASTAGSGCNCP